MTEIVVKIGTWFLDAYSITVTGTVFKYTILFDAYDKFF